MVWHVTPFVKSAPPSRRPDANIRALVALAFAQHKAFDGQLPRRSKSTGSTRSDGSALTTALATAGYLFESGCRPVAGNRTVAGANRPPAACGSRERAGHGLSGSRTDRQRGPAHPELDGQPPGDIALVAIAPCRSL